MYSKKELIEKFTETIGILSAQPEGELSEEVCTQFAPFFYTPDTRLPSFLSELSEKIKQSDLEKSEKPRNFHVQIGQLLEKIAYICLNGLQGVTSIKSFQSPGPQYDFLVAGDGPQWKGLCDLLYLDFNRRDILVEIKATKKKISDEQFARLCSLLDLNLFNTGGIGVFFTLSGASGFPSSTDNNRQRSLKNARLRQVMYKVSREKPIVVLDQNDIFELDKPGSFVELLIRKIRELDYLTGLYLPPQIEEPCEKDLPKHIKKDLD